jgi:alpha-2-macroglobulin
MMMPIARMLPLLLLFLVTPAADAAAQRPLRVVRTTPTGDGSPATAVTVMFDRPVAGSLERSVDPARVMRVEPAIAGRFEWRDPVTLRWVPAAALPADARITITVGTDFTAMDGTRLAEPHRFAFRVRGPLLLLTRPVSRGAVTPNLRRDQRFELVYSEPVDAARFAESAMIEMSAACTPRMVRVRVEDQRTITAADGYPMTEAGGWQRDRTADSLRRVVRLVPRAPLPLNCAGDLVVPEEFAEGSPKGVARLAFRTYGPFRFDTARCGWRDECPTGPVRVTFTTPVRGALVQRHLRLIPEAEFRVSDTAAVSTAWTLEATLQPRRAYAVVADTAIRDAFGQRISGNPASAIRTTGFTPAATYPFGRQLVERIGFRTLPVEHINADTLLVEIAAVPDSLERQFLSRYAWGFGELWGALQPGARVQRIPVRATVDRGSISGVPLPVADATRAGTASLYAVKVRASAARPGPNARADERDAPIALVQVTDLGVTARVGADEGTVWVTGVSDGRPRAGADVVLYDDTGRRLAGARTDALGIARMTRFAPAADAPADAEGEQRGDGGNAEGFVTVTLGADRAVVPINRYDPDLAPWVFGVRDAWGASRLAVAGAVFTERGIYRPGEQVHAKAIVRDGALGALRRPQPGDSLRWLFLDRDGEPALTRTVALSAFGTADIRHELPAAAAIGDHSVAIAVKRQGRWQSIAGARFRVAEYRPPEFLMDLIPQRAGGAPGERFRVLARGRYLFGAPMARAVLTWEARHAPVEPWELEIPGTEGWTVGRQAWSWIDTDEQPRGHPVALASGTDTLDAAGEHEVSVTLPAIEDGAARRVTLTAAVTDVNRQVVGSAASTVVHPAAFYVAVRAQGNSWFWREGQEEHLSVRAVRPDGAAQGAVDVRGTLVRREWHQVRRERNGMVQLVGEWVTDTVDTCTVRTPGAGAAACPLTPAAGGMHVASFEATDAEGRRALTTMSRWVAGSGFVPWGDETQFKMELIADRERYSVGDTATVLLAAPFTEAEAWLTVERERIIETRRLRITDGATTVKIPITEAHAPNAFVSVVLVRGRSAPPGRIDDPGRPTLRVGYTELRVTPEVKRLAVEVRPLQAEYRPADTARVRVRVRDTAQRGARSEVTLWAVDEGVLALTGYRTPDPIDLLYAPRALGLRLASNLASVTPQVPEGEKGQREAGGGGGAGDAEILRSRFKTTAFFLGSVVTDSTGEAVAAAALPDNLTTFRVMAVAVTDGDRYGSGESPMLVTRPLVARAALPRFVRPGDDLMAGATVNRRDGAAREVRVTAAASGIRREGPAARTVTLEAGRGSDVRFRFRAQPGDSAAFTFTARSGSDADAVRVAVPVKPDHHPRAHTIAGVLRDTATVEFMLPADIDPERSRLTLTVGSSPLAILRGAHAAMRVYPYDCTEQLISGSTTLMALLAAPGALSAPAQATARADLARAVQALLRRQRTDGGIGYWSPADWTTPWLSAYAGMVLLDARALGVPVDSAPLARLEEYLRATMRGERGVGATPVARWYESRWTRLADQLASADFLSRLGRPDQAAENELLRMAPQLAREDRIRLATVLLRRGATGPARTLLGQGWDAVRVEGQRAVLTDSGGTHYFRSTMREIARLLMATLMLEPSHVLVGPMVETLASQGRAARYMWNTQDRAFAVQALAAFEARQREAPPRAVRVRSGRRTLAASATGTETSVALTGLLGDARDETRVLRLDLDAAPGSTGQAPAFYHLTVSEVPLAPPVRPAEQGIRVERWYERFSDGTPVTSVMEGELVRVRLRVTVSAERQFVVLDDALPGGLEAIDLSLRTATTLAGPGAGVSAEQPEQESTEPQWGYGRWDSGWWTPWDHREIRDDRVVYSAALLWPGTYNATYVARATTPGTFVRPPAHAEEMYNPGVNGRSDGGMFTVTARGAPR